MMICFITENVNRPKDFDAMKKEEMLMDRRVGSRLPIFLCFIEIIFFLLCLYVQIYLYKIVQFYARYLNYESDNVVLYAQMCQKS